MRTKITIVLFFVFLSICNVPSKAQLFNQLEQAYNTGQITVDEMMLNKIYRSFDPSKVNTTYISDLTSVIKCGTAIVMEYDNIKNNLNPNSVAIIENYLAIDGDLIAYISPGGHFKLSYTTSGADAVPIEDDVNVGVYGVPDYIERIANYLDQSWLVEIENCLFAAPNDVDVDGYYNIYFQLMPSDFGYTRGNFTEGTKIILNSNFPSTFATQDPDGNQIGLAKVTCAHELKHASQWMYGEFPRQMGWAELDATWAEELVYDYVNQSMLYYTLENGRYTLFSIPILALTGNYENYYWEDYLHQKFDNNSYTSAPLLLDFMERRAAQPDESVLDSYDYVLQNNFGSSLSEAFTEFIVWNFYTGSRAVQGFGYDEAGIVGFPEVQLRNTHSSYPANGSGSGLGHLSSNHILLYPGGQDGLKVNFTGSYNVNMEAVVTWSNGSSVTWEKIDLGIFNGGELFTDTKSFGALLPIVTARTGSGLSYAYSIDPAAVYNISFTNQIGSSTNAGGNFVIDGDTYNVVASGQGRNLVEQRTHNAKTNNERFENWSGDLDYKQHHWNNEIAENKLLHGFQAISSGSQYSRFMDMHYGKIEARLESSLISGKGNFQFQDPWYALSDNSQPENFWISASGSYEPIGKEGATDKGVFLNQNPQFQQGIPNYSVQAPQTQNINLGSPQGTRTFYFQNWSGAEVQFDNASALQTGVVFKDNIPGIDPIVSANYKGHLLSDNTAGFSSNSQRKFISDANGIKHLVYESQGNVWYTKSTNNGSTWQQEVKLNDDGTQAKGAAIATSSDGYLYILYQCDRGIGSNYNPALILSQYSSSGTLRWRENVCNINSYAYNTTPVISAINDVVLVLHKPSATYGLSGKEYILNNGNVSVSYIRNIPGTTQYSTNPSLATNAGILPKKHMLVYQESYTTIYYKKWTVASDFTGLVTTNISTGSPYPINEKPSIIDFGYGARVCWSGGTMSQYSFTVFRDPDYSYLWSFGTYATVPSINKTDGNTAYYIGWKESGTGFKIVDGHLSSNYIKTLTGLQGSAIQLSNGVTSDAMYAVTFNNATQPYALSQSTSLNSYYQALSKENSNGTIASGRAGVVIKDAAQFFFMLGDIEVTGEKIRFKQLCDTLRIPTIDVLNTLVESEPFELKANSSFTYSVEYGVTDSSTAAQVLQNDEHVKFKVELVDASSGQIVGTLDPVTYSKNFLQSYSSIDYQVNTEAISTKDVKLRLIVDHSGDADYSITDRFYEEDVTLAKKGLKVIGLNVNLQIKDYALAQNYPNPFNPATTITYQLPKSGSVTLKIFDILGNEVRTLVDENREMGRYTVQFDASSLASGMYVYQLRVNDYSSTKKLMLMK